LAQAYAHTKYSFNDRFTLNAGIHSQYFFLNASSSFEPRLRLKYELNSKSSLNFGYGLHPQIQPINVYFLQSQNGEHKARDVACFFHITTIFYRKDMFNVV